MDRYVTVQESGKRLTALASLPLIVLVVTVTVLVPVMNIPPPCKGIDAFSSFITLHWGDGVGLSFSERSPPAGKVQKSTTSSMEGGRGSVSQSIGAIDCYVTVQDIRGSLLLHCCD